ncbi:MAG: hypothetical protein HFH06_10690 [Lachnospiraceae bacterium]|nr:hypothetical protein [Lachnospiraceae bacterium]
MGQIKGALVRRNVGGEELWITAGWKLLKRCCTYQQMMARKMMYQNMLSLYEIYGLTGEKDI